MSAPGSNPPPRPPIRPPARPPGVPGVPGVPGLPPRGVPGVPAAPPAGAAATGAAAAPKKKVGPKIPVKKEPVDGAASSALEAPKPHEKKPNVKKEDEDKKGKGRERPVFVQQQGIFSDGFGAEKKRAPSQPGQKGIPSILTKSSSSNSKLLSTDEKKGKASSSKEFKEEESESSEEEDGAVPDETEWLKSTPAQMRPLTIPFSSDEIAHAAASAASVGSHVLSNAASSSTVPPPNPADSRNLQKAIDKMGDTLLFFQLPDTLPLHTSPGGHGEDGKPLDAKPVAGGADGAFKSTLKDVPAGQIGKLRVRASGRMELVIGDIEMIVSAGAPNNFHQRAMAVDTTGIPTLFDLGPISQRYIVTPDFDKISSAINSGSSQEDVKPSVQ